MLVETSWLEANESNFKFLVGPRKKKKIASKTFDESVMAIEFLPKN